MVGSTWVGRFTTASVDFRGFNLSAKINVAFSSAYFPAGLDLDELISAGEKCDSDKLDAADEACSAALESNPNTICPPACQELFNVR